MDFLASPLGVLAILAVVAVVASVYKPAKYVGIWRDMAKRYETTRRPSSLAFHREDVALGNHEFACIDAALDDEGFWMVQNGPEPKKLPSCVLIPWDCIRFKAIKDDRYNFQIRLKGPAEFLVSPELGKALQRRSQSMPDGLDLD